MYKIKLFIILQVHLPTTLFNELLQFTMLNYLH